MSKKVKGAAVAAVESRPAKVKPTVPVSERAAFSVEEFCRVHGLARATFYLLLKSGQGPRTFKVGTRRLVSREAAERWRAEREAAEASSCAA